MERADGVTDHLVGAVTRRCEAERAAVGPRLPVRVLVGGHSVSGAELVNVVAGRPADRFLLLGEAGAGKTTVACDLVLGLLARRAPTDAVPVLLPISTWRPAEQRLRDWAVGQLGDDAGHRRLYLVLDGLGESVTPSPADVLAALHRDLAEGDGLVLTARSDVYAALRATDPIAARSVVAAVQPLPPGDVAAWLPDEQRWRAVRSTLVERPGDPVAQALSTPEMASLARAAFARDGDPRELVGRGSRGEVEERALDRFLANVSAADRPRLAFVARHLDRSGTRDLAWWRWPAAVPGTVRGLTVQLGAGLLLATALGVATGGWALFCLGLGFGLSFGLQGWPSDGTGGSYAWRSLLSATFTLALAEVYEPVAAVAAAAVIGLLTGIGYGWRKGLVVGSMSLAGAGLGSWLPGEYVWSFLIGVLFAFTTGLAFWLLFADMGRRPARVRPRVDRATAARFLRRFALGAAASASATIIVALVGRAGLAFAATLGVACGLAGGITVWLAAAADTYATRPRRLLRHDRSAALASGLAVGALIALGGWAATALFIRFSDVRAFIAVDAIPVTVVAGLAAGLAIALGRSWGRLALARIWLGLTRRLPLRVMAFLADMNDRGVLVERGGVYRFRYPRLQDHLSSRG
jgi:hypothetical protein